MSYKHPEEPDRHSEPKTNGSGHSWSSLTEVTMIPLTSRRERRPRTVPLKGKVALIVGGATENGRSLAVAFAERGIDVAIVYFNGKHDMAEEIKQQVEAHERRCLLISGNREEDDENEEFSRRTVRRILDTLGRLDIFINYSARIFPFRYIMEEETQQQRAIRSQIFPHFTMMKAALDQIVG